MPLPQSRPLLLLIVLAVTALTAVNISATPYTITQATSYLSTECLTNGVRVSHGATVPSSASLSCDTSTQIQTGQSLLDVGSAVSTLGSGPMVDVAGEAESGGTPLRFEPGATGSVLVTSQVVLYFAAEPIGPTPVPTSVIPIKIIWNGESSITGQAYAQISLVYGVAHTTPGTVTAYAAAGEEQAVSLEATCYAVSWDNFNSGCQAVADPSFEFDQAAFDQQMGSQTYNLANYFTLALSPNVAATPEPSVFWLLASGLLVLWGKGEQAGKAQH